MRKSEIRSKIDTEIVTTEIHLSQVEKHIWEIDAFSQELSRLLNENLTSLYVQGDWHALKEYQEWLARVAKLKSDNFAITQAIKEAPALMKDPYPIMENVKKALKVLFDDAQKSLANRMQIKETIEERLHRLEVERDTLEFGKASVDLTNINIKVAIWVPIVVFGATLLLIVIFESFKPEITDWIRHLVGLATIPKWR